MRTYPSVKHVFTLTHNFTVKNYENIWWMLLFPFVWDESRVCGFILDSFSLTKFFEIWKTFDRFSYSKIYTFWLHRPIFYNNYYKIWKNDMKFNFFDCKIIVFHDFITVISIKSNTITWDYNLSVLLFTTFWTQSMVGNILERVVYSQTFATWLGVGTILEYGTILETLR